MARRKKLKKGDQVVMHSCGEAEHYNGKVWTCERDEFSRGKGMFKQNLVFLEGFSGTFLTEYLQRVKV